MVEQTRNAVAPAQAANLTGAPARCPCRWSARWVADGDLGLALALYRNLLRCAAIKIMSKGKGKGKGKRPGGQVS